jgi:hypothetical protein
MCFVSPVVLPQQARFAQRCQKVLLHAGQLLFSYGRSGDQYELDRFGEIILVDAKRLPQQPSGTAANHGIADLAAGDDTQAQRGARRQPAPIRNQTTGNQALALLPHPGKIPALFDTRRAIELQRLGQFGGHGPVLNGSQPLAAHTTAIGEDGPAALARFASQKAMLAFAAHLGRLILSFHKSIQLHPEKLAAGTAHSENPGNRNAGA